MTFVYVGYLQRILLYRLIFPAVLLTVISGCYLTAQIKTYIQGTA